MPGKQQSGYPTESSPRSSVGAFGRRAFLRTAASATPASTLAGAVPTAAWGATAGKDFYCEKPLTLTVDEGKQILEVQQKTGRVGQVGTQQRRYYSLFTKAVAFIAEDRLGKIKRIQAAIDGNP